MKKKTDKQGEGHKARVAVDAKATVTVDGKTQEFAFNYDVTITVEMIDYAVRQLASGIAQVADRVARNGVSGLKAA